MKHLVALFVLPYLVACGGGGGGESASETSADAAAVACVPKTPVRIQLFGDSTMRGYTAETDSIAEHNPPALLQAALDSYFGQGTTLVTVRAVSGTTAKQLLNGTDGLNSPWPGDVSADIVIINHGINDMTHDRDVPSYFAALRGLAANTGGSRLIFETPNIVAENDMTGYVKAMKDTAKEFGLPVADTYAYTSTLPDWHAALSDWAHPKDATYVNIVKYSLAPAVIPEVAPLLCR